MKKPVYPILQVGPDDRFELDLSEIQTLGDLREKTAGFPDHIEFYPDSDGGGYFVGESFQFQERKRKAIEKYHEGMKKYDSWYRSTPEYQDEAARALRHSEAAKQEKIKRLKKELAELEK